MSLFRHSVWFSFPRINAKKKCNNTALPAHVCVKPRSGTHVLDLGIQQLLSTIPTFNMLKVNRYDNRGKISRTSSENCESKK